MRKLAWVTLGVGMGAVAAYVVTSKGRDLLSRHPQLVRAKDAGEAISGLRTVPSRIRTIARMREDELRQALGMPDGEEDAQARERWQAARASRAQATSGTGQGEPGQGARPPAGQVPGGLKPEDLLDPLYEF